MVESDKIILVLAILFTSGYACLPNRRLYWENSNDVHNVAISSAMTVNRFEEILRYMHVSDNNNLEMNEKIAKVRPLFNMLNDRFLAHFPISENLSIDESMVPYFGCHGCKQFIHGKPICFGYKVWCLNTSGGYMIQCDPYQGATEGGYTHPELGLGGSVVMDLLADLPHHSFKLYIDNIFASLKLVDALSQKNIGVVGTIRIEQCPVQSADTMKKQPRGTYDYRYDQAGCLSVVRWNDNSVVTLASNFVGVNPQCVARRW